MTHQELFQHLWTKAVGTPGYSKEQWKELESFIQRPLSERIKMTEGCEPISKELHEKLFQRMQQCARVEAKVRVGALDVEVETSIVVLTARELDQLLKAAMTR